MTGITLGLAVSVCIVFFLAILFSHEQKRGVRYGERTRRHVDFLVLSTTHSLHQASQYVSRRVVRQTAHYSFHVVLSWVLNTMRKWENGLRAIIRTNKTLARSAERERTERNKLEEIALHKIAVSLSEEEKQAHKEKTLNGM